MTTSAEFFKGTACGKAILVGEHAVVYGAKALAVPLKALSLEVLVTPLKHPGYGTVSEFMFQGSLRPMPVFQHWLEDAFEFFCVAYQPLQLAVSSTIPMGAGLGSSAALCVALLKALSAYLHIPLDRTQLAHGGKTLEKRFHGNPSGLDPATVAYGLPVLFSKSKQVEQIIDQPYPFDFVLIDSGLRASTRTMIEKAKPFFTGPGQTAILEQFHHSAEQAYASLVSGEGHILAQAMTRTQKLLQEAGVVPEALVEGCRRALACGVLSIKVTGAGGGGYLLGLLPTSLDERTYSMSCLYQTFTTEGVYSFHL